MGLRLTDGIDPSRFEALAGQPIDQAHIDALIEDGFLETSETGALRVTATGVPVLNTIIEHLSV